MKRGIVGLILTLAFASSVHAAPGDPRLIQGVVEWPPALTVEPFVVVRAEDGRWYYTEIKGAKRFESASLAAGARVAVLGVEGTRPHEITAIALGSGDAATLAVALMPHVNAPIAASPPAPLAKPEPNAATPATTPPAATATAAATTPAPPAAKAPQPPASDPAPPARPAVTEPTEKPTPVKSELTGSSTAVVAEPPRWMELQGTIKVIAGNWVVVRGADGHLVLVDLSTVRGGAASLQPGSSIVVYGTPGEQKFQAMGIVRPENQATAKPATVPPRR